MNLSQPLDGLVRPMDAAILRALARTVDGLTGRRIEQIIESRSRSGIVASLDRLVRIGIVSRAEVGNSALYSLNRQHLTWEPLFEILGASVALQTELRNLVERLYPEAPQPATALYGSVARGESTLESDIDIVMVFRAGSSPSARASNVELIERTIASRFGNRVEIVDIDIDQLSDLVRDNDPLAESWLDDAITVTGPNVKNLIRNVPR